MSTDVYAAHAEALADARKRFPPMWVIYDHPSDFPDFYVARVCYGEVKSHSAMVCSDLEQLRIAVVNEGASFNIGRYEGDDPVILEVWI